MEYTHFISLPLGAHETLREKLATFRQCILAATSSSEGISPLENSIFIDPATLHLTVLMLHLPNEERVRFAGEVLQKTLPHVLSILEGRFVSIHIKGVRCMGENPAQAHVLYACIEEADYGNRLRHACEAIIEAFDGAGLVPKKVRSQTLKFHATIINTRHREETCVSFQNRMPHKVKRIPFDARRILRDYGSHDWGQYLITEAHLSERGNYDENGYYRCCASILFPSCNRST